MSNHLFQTVGIIGAGTMGSGIATNLAQNGIKIRLIDNSLAAAQKGKSRATAFYQKAVDKGRMDSDMAMGAGERIHASENLEDLTDCDLIIEAIFEEFEVKAILFKKLDKIVSSTAVVATNTSALTVSGLAETISNPSRFLGLHYFNPAAINPIVEVVKGDKTDDAIYDKALNFIRDTKKTPIACKDSYGFAINRFFVPYGNEAMRLLDEGLGTIPQIERISKEVLQVAAGPFQVMNLVKARIMFHAQRNLAPHGDFYSVAEGLNEIGEKDHEFDLTGDETGIASNDKVIGDRLMMSCFFPVLQEIDENVASASDIDLGAKEALKFGIGPCELMDQMGQEAVSEIIRLATDRYNHETPNALDKVGNLL